MNETLKISSSLDGVCGVCSAPESSVVFNNRSSHGKLRGNSLSRDRINAGDPPRAQHAMTRSLSQEPWNVTILPSHLKSLSQDLKAGLEFQAVEEHKIWLNL